MSKTKQIRRKIIKIERWMNKGWEKSRFTGGSYHFKLECGHEHYRKISGGIPKTNTVRCDDCMALANGRRSQRGNVRETWDAEKQWPVFTEITS